MKTSKFTEAQIIYALRQAEGGTKVAEVCRKMGISEATFYNWKKKYGGLGTSELRRLKQLEAENQQLKKLVADLSLDKHMLQEVIKKSCEASPAARACAVSHRRLSHLRPEGMPRRGAGPFNVQLQAPSKER
jgi:putative transposase